MQLLYLRILVCKRYVLNRYKCYRKEFTKIIIY